MPQHEEHLILGRGTARCVLEHILVTGWTHFDELLESRKECVNHYGSLAVCMAVL